MRKLLVDLSGFVLGFTISLGVTTVLAQQAPVQLPMLDVVSPLTVGPLNGCVGLLAQDAKRRQFGLSSAIQGPLAYSWIVQNGTASVFEGGLIRKIVTVVLGTNLQVIVTNGQVDYVQDGVSVFTSPTLLTEGAHPEAKLEDSDTVLGRLTIVPNIPTPGGGH